MCVCLISPFMYIIDYEVVNSVHSVLFSLFHLCEFCMFHYRISYIPLRYIALLLFTSVINEPAWKEPDKNDDYIPAQFHLSYLMCLLATNISLLAVIVSLASHRCFFYLPLHNQQPFTDVLVKICFPKFPNNPISVLAHIMFKIPLFLLIIMQHFLSIFYTAVKLFQGQV